MDFARQQRDPTRHLVGIAFVILVHALVIWALLSGLGQKVIEVVKKPMTATIVETVKPPPPVRNGFSAETRRIDRAGRLRNRNRVRKLRRAGRLLRIVAVERSART